MLRTLLVSMLFSTVFLFACSGESEAPVTTAETAEKIAHAEAWREDQLLKGQQTYEAACASCHDTGEGGAPVTGDAADWSPQL